LGPPVAIPAQLAAFQAPSKGVDDGSQVLGWNRLRCRELGDVLMIFGCLKKGIPSIYGNFVAFCGNFTREHDNLNGFSAALFWTDTPVLL